MATTPLAVEPTLAVTTPTTTQVTAPWVEVVIFRALRSLIQGGLAVVGCQPFYYELKSCKKNIFLP
jgi:hypothetical protein